MGFSVGAGVGSAVGTGVGSDVGIGAGVLAGVALGRSLRAIAFLSGSAAAGSAVAAADGAGATSLEAWLELPGCGFPGRERMGRWVAKSPAGRLSTILTVYEGGAALLRLFRNLGSTNRARYNRPA
jgi:hypothetical protein